jgi:hypothetical protein
MGETTLRASFLSAPWLIYETTYLLRMQECRVMRSCNSFSGGRAPLGWDTDSLICLLGSQTQQTHGLHLQQLYQPYFCEGFFKIDVMELFAQIGFELGSSWSLPPE